MQRQEHKYRGFIKGNAHGIKWGREGNSDSRQTMMHFDPEWGKEGRLDVAALGCHAVAIVWQDCPSAKVSCERSRVSAKAGPP